MKNFVVFIIVLACANKFVQSLPVDEIRSDVSVDKIREKFARLLEKLEIDVDNDFVFPPGVKVDLKNP